MGVSGRIRLAKILKKKYMTLELASDGLTRLGPHSLLNDFLFIAQAHFDIHCDGSD